MPTRARLLDAAWAVVRADGLRAATSRRIAANAMANLGAITYHFGSKDALLAQVAADRIARWLSPLGDALVADQKDGGGRTDRYIASLFDLVGTTAEETRALVEILIGLPAAADIVREEFTSFHAVVADVMVDQRRRGEIPATVEPAAMAGVFTSFALGLMLHQVLGTAPATPERIVGQLLGLLAPR